MLGLFDSGLGGLSVLRELRTQLPDADILYFADQAHAPYGDRSVESLRELLHANLAWLNARGCDAIVMACNTSCAIAREYGWPQSRAPVFDLIEAAETAVAQSGRQNVAVVATSATVRVHAYANAIRAKANGIRVTEVAAPALVPLVESVDATDEERDAAVAEVCARLPSDADAIVYGCTHYPLLDGAFARHTHASMMRIDPAHTQAVFVARVAQTSGAIAGTGRTYFVTSGEIELFRERLTALGQAEPTVEKKATLPFT